MKLNIVIFAAALLTGWCKGESCQDTSVNCNQSECNSRGLVWSAKNCASTCGYCTQKCQMTRWVKDCSVTCGIGVQTKTRVPVKVVSGDTPHAEDCFDTVEVGACVKKPCPPSSPQTVLVHQPQLVPALATAGVAAGATALAGAATTVGATLGETFLALLPEMAMLLGKRSALEEREVLDLFIQKLQEKRQSLK
ncbi:uncharacterized protein LOC134252609 [Saccostrea cucullata]|uniref:uncharacterized protein LOC134252609 n=1 Tax=Saccostrea cuccullata TaxID=36930 RepID=UPI002ED46519